MRNREYEDWIAAATDDFDMACLALENGYWSHVCFFSQQVVEKSLKSLFLIEGKVYPKTHKLIDLLTNIGALAKEIKDLEAEFRVLDEYYLPTRYPDAIPGARAEGLPEKTHAEKAIETARKVLSIVKEMSE